MPSFSETTISERDLDTGGGFALVFFPVMADSPALPLDLTTFVVPGDSNAEVVGGTVTVIEFHADARTFLGELKDLTLSVSDSMQNSKTCRLPDGLLWAVPGNFE